MTTRQLAALLGFAFVAAWIGFGFGYSVLCLVGAAAFSFAAGVSEGQIDLAELQARLGAQRDPIGAPVQRPASTVPKPRARPRVL